MPPLPRITPVRLARFPDPFDHPDWLFELKWDGFWAVAYIEVGACRLVSRNGNAFQTFPGLCEQVAAAIGRHDAILDGEVVVLDASGRAQFYPLLYRRANPYYYCFDCLWLDGRDLRGLPLVSGSGSCGSSSRRGRRACCIGPFRGARRGVVPGGLPETRLCLKLVLWLSVARNMIILMGR